MSRREVGRMTAPEAVVAGGVLFALGAVAPALITRAKLWLRPGGKFTNINSAVAGARSEKALPKGKHSLQLYSMATPNGQKVTCALEEMGLKYDAYLINILEGEQFTSGFVAVNPNSKIPAMVDYDGPKGEPLRLFESGSILLYLAEKTGKLIPKDPTERVECINFLFFQVGSAPYFGQFGHFTRYAPAKIQYAVDRYAMEVKRLLSVLDQHLEGRKYLVGSELTIADLAWMPWVQGLSQFYKADDSLGLTEYTNVARWKTMLLERPAVAKGMKINSFSSPPELKEYHSA